VGANLSKAAWVEKSGVAHSGLYLQRSAFMKCTMLNISQKSGALEELFFSALFEGCCQVEPLVFAAHLIP
jgi:hypothetical protein